MLEKKIINIAVHGVGTIGKRHLMAMNENQNVNLSLAAGDYVQFGCYTSSGAHGGNWSKWGGTLIG